MNIKPVDWRYCHCDKFVGVTPPRHCVKCSFCIVLCVSSGIVQYTEWAKKLAGPYREHLCTVKFKMPVCKEMN